MQAFDATYSVLSGPWSPMGTPDIQTVSLQLRAASFLGKDGLVRQAYVVTEDAPSHGQTVYDSHFTPVRVRSCQPETGCAALAYAYDRAGFGPSAWVGATLQGTDDNMVSHARGAWTVLRHNARITYGDDLLAPTSVEIPWADGYATYLTRTSYTPRDVLPTLATTPYAAAPPPSNATGLPAFLAQDPFGDGLTVADATNFSVRRDEHVAPIVAHGCLVWATVRRLDDTPPVGGIYVRNETTRIVDTGWSSREGELQRTAEWGHKALDGSTGFLASDASRSGNGGCGHRLAPTAFGRVHAILATRFRDRVDAWQFDYNDGQHTPYLRVSTMGRNLHIQFDLSTGWIGSMTAPPGTNLDA